MGSGLGPTNEPARMPDNLREAKLFSQQNAAAETSRHFCFQRIFVPRVFTPKALRNLSPETMKPGLPKSV